MNIRHSFLLAASISLLLCGCTTTSDERHLERLMHHPGWPRIEQIARTEVKKREELWPDTAAYLPQEHAKQVWTVAATPGDRNSGIERVVFLAISDDGNVLTYHRLVNGKPFPDAK